MGWDYGHAQYYKKGKIDRKRILDERFTWKAEQFNDDVIKSSMKGSTYYAAVKRTDKSTGDFEVWGLVCLTSTNMKDYCNLGIKAMCESEGPTARECPKSILDLLTPTESKWANEWRDDCRRNLARKKPGSLPVGTKIRFTTRNGKSYEIVKRTPAYQFRKNWWYNAADHTAFPSRYIPFDFEIVA